MLAGNRMSMESIAILGWLWAVIGWLLAIRVDSQKRAALQSYEVAERRRKDAFQRCDNLYEALEVADADVVTLQRKCDLHDTESAIAHGDHEKQLATLRDSVHELEDQVSDLEISLHDVKRQRDDVTEKYVDAVAELAEWRERDAFFAAEMQRLCDSFGPCKESDKPGKCNPDQCC